MKSTFTKYLSLCIVLMVLTELTKYVLNFDALFYNSLAENLTSKQIENLFFFQKKWQWVSYTIIPLLLLLKTTLVASVLYIGTFFFSKAKVTFKQLWDVTIKAEFIFLAVGILKIIWFYFFQTNYTLEDLQYFFPLSAINIIGYQGLETWFVYPLQTLNLFELTYWLLLSYFVGKLAFTEKDNGKPMDLGFKIVASSYGSALLLWVVAVMFFTLNYS
ncbi:hypothetical protein [Flavobacterium sp.]|uniref:hypothetical protein n=1 Tax=Flavobacterium sp. TaxID=239 RepID=UPI0040483BDB